MSTSIHTDDDAVSDEQVATETSDIKTAEALQTSDVPTVAEPAPVVEPEPTPEPVVDPPKSLNEERQAILNARSQANREAEQAEATELEPTPAVVPEPEPVSQLPEGVKLKDDGSYVAVMKIGGEEKEVPFDTVLTDAQRVVGVNAKLQERVSLLAENQALKARLAQSAPTQPPSGVEVSAPSTDEQQVITTETFNKALLDGDENAATAVVNRLNQQPLQVNPDQVIHEATQNAVLEIERKAAIASVSLDPINAEILADPELSNLANSYSAQLLNSEEHSGLSPAENIAQSLAMVREKFSMFGAQPQAEPALTTRTAQKVAHSQANQPLGTTQRQPLPVPHVATPISTRERMRNARIAGS